MPYRIIRPDDLDALRKVGSIYGQFPEVRLESVVDDSRTRYHERTNKIFCIKSGNGIMELDGAVHQVHEDYIIQVEPNTRYRLRSARHHPVEFFEITYPFYDSQDVYYE